MKTKEREILPCCSIRQQRQDGLPHCGARATDALPAETPDYNRTRRDSTGAKPGLSPDETGQFVLVSSRDDGQTWTEVYSITEQVKNPKWSLFFNGPGNGIVMEDGKLVFPAQYWDENAMPHSTIIYSE